MQGGSGRAERPPRGMDAREVRTFARPGGPAVELCSLAGDIRAFPNHLHDHYVIGALYASRRALTMGGRTLHVLEPGDIFLVNPGEPHACDPLDDEPFSYRCANVPAAVLRSAVAGCAAAAAQGGPRTPGPGARPAAGEGPVAAGAPADGRAPRFAVPVLRDPALFARADALFADASSGGMGDESVLDELAALAAALFAAAGMAAGPAGALSAPGELVARARAFIDGRYAERIALDEVAGAAGVSRYALVRAFKRELGITPGRYLAAVRVMHAKSLLEQGCAPAAAAGLTGFADQAHLGRVFRNVTGLTPARYRAAYRREAL